MPSKTPSRPEGEKWFEWPLTPASVGMTSAELVCELYETISTLNRDRGWNLTMVAPARFGEVVIDDLRRSLDMDDGDAEATVDPDTVEID